MTMQRSYIAQQNDSAAAKLRLEMAQKDAADQKLKAEQDRQGAYQAHRELLPKVHDFNFSTLLAQIVKLPILHYPNPDLGDTQWPTPLCPDNSCLVDRILEHPNLTAIEKIELTTDIYNVHPAYTDILYKKKTVDFFLTNEPYHELLKTLYLTTCKKRPEYIFYSNHEDAIWNLLLQKNLDTLKNNFQPHFEKINQLLVQVDNGNRADYSIVNKYRARLLRFAMHWLNQAENSGQVIDIYNKIKQLFSACPRLGKYIAPYLHQMADMLVIRFSSKEDKCDAGKDLNFDFLDQRYSFFSRCWGLTKSQELYNKIKNPEEKSEKALNDAITEVENELNEKFQRKYAFETKLRR